MSEIILDIQNKVVKTFPKLGINKQRELLCLLYEIYQREQIDVDIVLEGYIDLTYREIKASLIKRRYPGLNAQNYMDNIYFPDIFKDADKNFTADLNKKFYPTIIYYDEYSSDSEILKKFSAEFPASETIKIKNLKTFVKDKKFSIATFNDRRSNVFLIEQKHDKFKTCPCTKKCLKCNYFIFNLGFGCPFECSYCYLQEYSNTPGIILPTNIEAYFEEFTTNIPHGVERLGTGEFSDSLALDHITNYSEKIIEFMRNKPEYIFEFKTKSNNVDSLLKNKPPDNVVVAWSLNPQSLIDVNEFYSATLDERLEAAKKCTDAGYKVAFHYDPIIYYPSWELDYYEVIDKMFSTVASANIAWISMGTFRCVRELKKIMIKRFPESKILNENIFLGYDGKLRYPDALRKEIYVKLSRYLKKQDEHIKLYLCMEEPEFWNEAGLKYIDKWQ